jgi:hypothetical protein
MPTNEERKEIAAKLRALTEGVLDSREYEHRAICAIVGCWGNEEYSNMELKDRLADLIEPESEPERTCQIIQHRCTNCDYKINDNSYFEKIILDDWRWTAEGRTANFCPNCGMKVVG